MINRNFNGSETLDRLHRIRVRLDELLPRLEEANIAFASATKPLGRLSDLDSQQRRELAKRVRATIGQCEQVTTQINQALADLNADFRGPHNDWSALGLDELRP